MQLVRPKPWELRLCHQTRLADGLPPGPPPVTGLGVTATLWELALTFCSSTWIEMLEIKVQTVCCKTGESYRRSRILTRPVGASREDPPGSPRLWGRPILQHFGARLQLFPTRGRVRTRFRCPKMRIGVFRFHKRLGSACASAFTPSSCFCDSGTCSCEVSWLGCPSRHEAVRLGLALTELGTQADLP